MSRGWLRQSLRSGDVSAEVGGSVNPMVGNRDGASIGFGLVRVL